MTSDIPEAAAGSAFDQQIARIAVGAYDDAQDVRTAMMNRVRDVIRKRNEDIPFDEVEDEKDEDDKDYDAKYKDENLPDLVEVMLDDGDLTDREYEYLTQMLDAARQAKSVENQYKGVMQITETEPIFTHWLTHVYGVSTILTARLIHQFGYCEKFEKVSNMWSYSGLAPGQERVAGEQLSYSPEAKTLAWLVADRMIMQGNNSFYKQEFYDPYKEKQMRRMEMAEEMTDEELAEKKWSPPNSRGHADTRARRYLAKKFLKHYWALSREMQGLDTPDEWVITHGGHEKRTDTFENPFYARDELLDRAREKGEV